MPIKVIFSFFAAIGLYVLSQASAFCQVLPDNLKFKKLGNKETLTLKQCALLSGVRNFEIVKKGKGIRPPVSKSRKNFTFPERYKFFACVNDTNGASLYVKKTANSDVLQYVFSEQDFPVKSGGGNQGGGSGGGIKSACPNGTRGIVGGILYKPAADAADHREGKPVVLLSGSNKTRTSALRIFASNGKEICRFTFKASSIPGVNGGADHYFSGWNGGCGSTGSQLAGAARSASGDSNIYVEWKGGQCLGPVNPTSRVGGV